MKKLAIAFIGTLSTLAILGIWLLAMVHTTAEAGGPASATFSVRVMWGNSSNSSLTLWSWPQTKQVDVIETRTNLTSFHQSWETSPASTPFIIMPSNDPRTEAVYLNEVNNGSSYFWSHWNNACSPGPEIIWQVEKMNGVDKVTVIVHNRANATMFASFDSGTTWSSVNPDGILDGITSARVGKVYFDLVPGDNPKPVDVCAYAYWNLDYFKFQDATPTPTATMTAVPTATATATTSPTATSSPTSSPVPPTSTATNTAIPATATSTATATNTATAQPTRYDFRSYVNSIPFMGETTLQANRFNYSGNRLVFSVTIPSGLSLPNVTGCDSGAGCTYTREFPQDAPVSVGEAAKVTSVEETIRGLRGGSYNLTGYFTEPATGAFAFHTITLQVVEPATATPTKTPEPGPMLQYVNPTHYSSMGGTTYTSPANATLSVGGIGARFTLDLVRVNDSITVTSRQFNDRFVYFDRTICLFGNQPDGSCQGWPNNLPNGDYDFKAVAYSSGGSYNSNSRRITVNIPLPATSTPTVTMTSSPTATPTRTSIPATSTPSATATIPIVSGNCLASLELPSTAQLGQRIDGTLTLTNTTNAPIWWQVTFASTTGEFNPIGSRVYGDNYGALLVRQVPFWTTVSRDGTFSTIISVEGQSGPCLYESKTVHVTAARQLEAQSSSRIYVPVVTNAPKGW